jgi:PKD repeat protein
LDGTLYTATVTISPNAPPTLSLTGPYSGAEGSAVSMRANASDPESQPLAYDWDFGDGSAHGVGATPSHAFPDNGSYNITVRVTDGVNTTTATTAASISNVAPTGTPVAPTAPVNQGTPFIIAISGATDPSPVDRASLQYRFSCGGGFGPLQSSPTFSCTQAVAGSYNVQMRIRDKDGAITTYSAVVAVANVAPVVVINNPNPIHIAVGGTLNFSGRFTDLGTTDNPWQGRITWGAGQGQKNLGSVTPGTNITALHAYTTAGTYTVTFSVQDKLGAVGQQSLTVIVP